MSSPSLLAGLVGPFNDLEQRFAPREVYLRGDEGLLTDGLRIAIVGSRRASEAGLATARRLARECAARGLVVVSGLAEGIDVAAHAATMNAGGRTIAVLGTPLDDCYPARHRPIQEAIGRDHLLVSQFAPGSKVQRGNFPQRNKVIVLVSDALVVIEAAEQSGTRDQVWSAIRVGRPVMIARHLFETGGVQWIEQAVGYGAEVIDSIDDLLSAIHLTGAPTVDG